MGPVRSNGSERDKCSECGFVQSHLLRLEKFTESAFQLHVPELILARR